METLNTILLATTTATFSVAVTVFALMYRTVLEVRDKVSQMEGRVYATLEDHDRRLDRLERGTDAGS